MAAKDWIEGSIKKAGGFRAAAKKAGKSTAEFAEEKDNAPGIMGKRARLAETLMNLRKKKG